MRLYSRPRSLFLSLSANAAALILATWIWIDRCPGNYLSGRLARTRFVIARSHSWWKSRIQKTAGASGPSPLRYRRHDAICIWGFAPSFDYARAIRVRHKNCAKL